MSAVKLMPPTRACGGSWYQSSAPEKEKLVVSGKKGTVHALAVENKSAATVYAFVYDGADHTGTLIAGPIPVASHGVGGFDWAYGIHFSTGLYVGLSTSDASWAADASADGWFSVGYTVEAP